MRIMSSVTYYLRRLDEQAQETFDQESKVLTSAVKNSYLEKQKVLQSQGVTTAFKNNLASPFLSSKKPDLLFLNRP